MRIGRKSRLLTGRLLNIEDWEISFPEGEVTYQLVLHDGAAAILAVDENGRVPLVRQARAGAFGEVLLEVPAGKLDDPNEPPLACAQRELEEEAGIRAERWELLCHAYPSPAYCTERIALFLATGLTQGEQHLDKDEYLDVVWLPLGELAAMAMRGDIPDMKTALCVLMAWGKQNTQ